MNRKKWHEFLTSLAVGYLQVRGYVVTYDPAQSNPLQESPAFGDRCEKLSPLGGSLFPCDYEAGHDGPCCHAQRAGDWGAS